MAQSSTQLDPTCFIKDQSSKISCQPSTLFYNSSAISFWLPPSAPLTQKKGVMTFRKQELRVRNEVNCHNQRLSGYNCLMWNLIAYFYLLSKPNVKHKVLAKSLNRTSPFPGEL
jgi:hypothetical protein